MFKLARGWSAGFVRARFDEAGGDRLEYEGGNLPNFED
jgi:hypothetical protein